MENIASLLAEKPEDVDFSLFEKEPVIEFIASYYDKYGKLPEKEIVETEMQISLPTTFAPWDYYKHKMMEDKFIRQALPVLTRFNQTYDQDQKQALLNLREQLMQLVEPEELHAVSIVKDLTRYERFKQQTNARIPTGIAPLDEASGGLSKKDEFAIISARLGIGKSWVAHAVGTNMCLAGYKVGIYSGEMSEDEVGARFDSLVSHLSNFALTRGKEVDITEHLQKMSEIQGDLLVLTPRHIGHNARPSDLRHFAKSENLDCLIIDQVSLMEPDGMRGGEDHERKAALSFQLKTLQQQLQIPIVAVIQLNRAAAQQEADASNLSGSDRFGQDATLILALSRKEDTLKIKVLKARSFRLPDSPWEFTWDIDKGLMEPKLSAMDSVKAKIKKANAQQKVEDDANAATALTDEGEDEIW